MKLQQVSGRSINNKEDENKPDVGSSASSRSATVLTPRASSTCPHVSLFPHRANTGTDPVATRPTTHERSKTSLQLGSAVRPDAATILTSRRTQSVSNPANAPPPPFTSDLSKSNTTRSARSPTTNAGVMPLRIKTPLGTAGGVAGVSAGGSRAGGEAGAVAGEASTTLRSRPSLRRPQWPGAPPVAQQSAPQAPAKTIQPGRYVNATQGVTPLVLPAAPAPAPGGECSFLVSVVYLSSALRSFHGHVAELTSV